MLYLEFYAGGVAYLIDTRIVRMDIYTSAHKIVDVIRE